MSIQHMRQRFAKQLRLALWILIAAFVIGLPLMFAPSGFFGKNREENQGPKEPSKDVLATVNGQPVTRANLETQFDRLVNQMAPYYAQTGQDIGLGMLWRIRYDAFEQAVQNQLLLQTAKERGLSVSKGELKQKAQQLLDQELAQIKAQYKDPKELEALFAKIISQDPSQKPRQTASERAFRKWAMSRYLSDEGGLREDMQLQKLQQTVAGETKGTESELLASFDQVAVHHIVISLNPSGKPKRTEEEAKAKAEELLAKIKGGADFAALAKAESDDPQAKQTGGYLDGITRGRMDATWDAAVFALKQGEVSGAIKLPWGYELVKMDKVTRQLPPDYEKNKQQLLASFTEQKKNEVWQKFSEDLRKKAKISVTDPEIIAYQALMKGEKDALAKLQAAKTSVDAVGGTAATAVYYQLGAMLAADKKWEPAADAFAEADNSLSSEKNPVWAAARTDALMGMAFCYEQLGQKEDAILWYSAASEASESPMLHSQLLENFTKLGKTDLAEQEKRWLADYQQQQKAKEQAMLEAQQKAAKAAAGAAAVTGANPKSSKTGK